MPANWINAILTTEVLYERDRNAPLRLLAQKALCGSCRERIRELSEKDLIHHELKARIDDLVRLRREHPEGSNAECICLDMITELISKLDLAGFRTLKIERIIDDRGESS